MAIRALRTGGKGGGREERERRTHLLLDLSSSGIEHEKVECQMDDSSVEELRGSKENRDQLPRRVRRVFEQRAKETRRVRTHNWNDEPIPLPRLIGDLQTTPVGDRARLGEGDVGASGFVEAGDGGGEGGVDDVL